MTSPYVSVVIPAYNCAASITSAIDSALSQNVELEILVINDCSNDSLDHVMEAYADNTSVIYIKNATNMGAAQSRNKGVAQARGKYIAFLDSDDYWAPNKLKKQLDILDNSDAVLCCTARELLSPEGTPTGRIIPVKSKIGYRDLLKHNSINCSSVLIRADVAREFPMNHEDSHEDYIMWLNITKKYGKAIGINEPLLKYRLSNTGKSGSKLHSARMTYKAYRYMGFGFFKSVCCFTSYAIHGVVKYTLSYFHIR